MAQAQAQTKVLYHGEFRELGTTEVDVLSGPIASTKKDGEFYVRLRVGGRERYYHPENEWCKDFWQGWKGHRLLLSASGAREDAKIEALEDLGTCEDAAPQAKAPAGQSTAPPKASPAKPNGNPPSQVQDECNDALAILVNHVAHASVMARVALRATASLANEWKAHEKAAMPNELMVAVYTSLLFGSNASVPVARLPKKIDFATLKPVTGGAK